MHPVHPAGHRQAPRARQTLLWAAGLFVLGQLLLLGASHTWLVRVRDPLFYTRLSWLTAPAASAQPGRSVLFLGTSRFQCGVRARLIERHLSRELGEPVRVANWGTGGHGAFRSLLAWDRLERLGHTPGMLLIEVLPALLSAHDPHLETGEADLPDHEIDAADLAVLHRHAPERIVSRWPLALLPAYEQRTNMRRLLLPALDGRHLSLARVNEDFVWQVGAERRPEGVARARREYFHRLARFEVGGPGVRALEELLSRVARQGLTACLVAMPEGPVFRSWYSPTTKAAIDRCLVDLARRHGLPLIDARGWMDAEEHFIDSHHLTGAGAAAFSERLTRDVVLPALRGRPVESLAAVPAVPAGRP